MYINSCINTLQAETHTVASSASELVSVAQGYQAASERWRPAACQHILTSHSVTPQTGGKFKPGAGTLSKTASQSMLTRKQSPPSR